MPVCIAGMHRSGTSMVARLLNLSGLYLGLAQDLLMGDASNPEGHWENVRFLELNESILRRFGGAWDVKPAWVVGWEHSDTVADLRAQAASLLSQFKFSGAWGWKDPRNSLTLPFWQDNVPDLKVVVCLRHPAAIVQSLEKRGRSSTLFGLNLWRDYYTGILAATTPATRLVTHYETYFDNCADELDRVLDYVGLTASAQQTAMAFQTVQEGLHHFRPAEGAVFEIPRELLDIYETLSSEAGPIYKTATTSQLIKAESLPEPVKEAGTGPVEVPTLESSTEPETALPTATVSVIVPNFNGRDFIGECLRSLHSLAFPKNQLEIIIVDDGSSDGSAQYIAEQFPGVVVVKHEVNQGFARAANSGATRATGEYVAFLNSDMRVEPDWLSELLRVVTSDTDVACVGSLILKWDSEGVDFAGRNDDAFDLTYDPTWRSSPYRPGQMDPCEILFASGGAMLIRKSEFEALGQFDPDYGMYHEDVDLGWRLWLLGRRVLLAPRSVVHHKGSASARQLPQTYFEGLLIRNAIATLIKTLEKETLLDLMPVLFFFLLERYSSLPQLKPVIPGAVADLQTMAASLAGKRATTQKTRVKTDAEIWGRLGHPLSFLITQELFRGLQGDLQEHCRTLLFDPNDAISLKLAFGFWLLAAQDVIDYRTVAQLKAAEQHLTGEIIERDKIIAQQGETMLRQDRLLVEKDGIIGEQGRGLTQQNEMLLAKNQTIEEQGRMMAEQNAMLLQKNDLIAEQGRTMLDQAGEIINQAALIEKHSQTMVEQDGMIKHQRRLLAEGEKALNRQRDDLAIQAETIRQMTGSKFWKLRDGYFGLRTRLKRVTGPVQRLPGKAARVLKKLRPNPKQRHSDFYRDLCLLPGPTAETEQEILSLPVPAARRQLPDIICFSIIDWSFRFQRPQQIMTQFAAQGQRVFYVRPAQFLPAHSQPQFSATERKPNIFEVSLTAHHSVDIYKQVIDDHNLASMRDSLAELREAFEIDEAVLYVMKVSWAHLALDLRTRWEWPVIYDCMDDWDGFPGIRPELVDLEPELVRACNLLVVTGQRLYDKWRPHQPAITLARNGVDYEFYEARLRPNSLLDGAATPIIGYIGALADWFDADLIAYAASQRPNYTFVLVGGVFSPEIAQLQNLPNVKLLGQQPYESMPQYVYDFDVCLIPFKVNSITAATDPVKLYEYLAAGKPIVTTALPELAPYQDYVLMAQNHGEFLSQLDKAALQDNPAQIPLRKALARDNTWAVRYEQIVAGLKNSVPQASIVVVTFNNLALTRLCLESVFRNTQYLNYQIIVVDNNSTDGTQEFLRNLAAREPHLSLILNPKNEGFAKANNQGLKQATGDYLVLLNNDTVVPPGWLNGLVRHLQNHAVGLVGPMTNFVGNEAKLEVPYKTWGAMEAFASKRAGQFAGQFADIHVLAMYCVALRRDTYAEIGELDEQFGIGMFEDDDYAMRIRQKGLRVICALDVFVHHFGQAAFSKLIQDGSYDPLFAQNKRLYEAKWGTAWTPHRHAVLTASGTTPAGKLPASVKRALPATLNPRSE